MQQLAFNLRSLTNGSQGLAHPDPELPGRDATSVPFYYAMLGVLALSMLASWFVRGSKLGLALFSIRDDEDRARGLGVQTELAKLSSFALSAGLVAMVGGVWAYYISFIYPQFAVDPLVTIGMVLMVYLGGRGTIWGPVLGAFILVPAQQYLAYRLGASELYLVGYSAVFLVVMLLLPRGILPSLRDRSRQAARPADARPGGARRRWRPRDGAARGRERLTKRFGGVVAVDDCSFAVEAGTITGLIGPNGSGKTTVFNLVTGYLPADGGDDPLRRPRRAQARIRRRLARRGLIRTFQQARVFPKLTVLENLALADAAGLVGRGPRARLARRARARAHELLADFNLDRARGHDGVASCRSASASCSSSRRR